MYFNPVQSPVHTALIGAQSAANHPLARRHSEPLLTTGKGYSDVKTYPSSVTKSLHTYKVVWTPTTLTWYFDDTMVSARTKVKVCTGFVYIDYNQSRSKQRLIQRSVAPNSGWSAERLFQIAVDRSSGGCTTELIILHSQGLTEGMRVLILLRTTANRKGQGNLKDPAQVMSSMGGVMRFDLES